MRKLICLLLAAFIVCSCDRSGSQRSTAERAEVAREFLRKEAQYPGSIGSHGMNSDFSRKYWAPAAQRGLGKLDALQSGKIKTATLAAFWRQLGDTRYLLYVRWLQADGAQRQITVADKTGPLIASQIEVLPERQQALEISMFTHGTFDVVTKPPYSPRGEFPQQVFAVNREVDWASATVGISARGEATETVECVPLDPIPAIDPSGSRGQQR